MQIEQALWDQGPAVVNAEIKRRIEELEPPAEEQDSAHVIGRVSGSSAARASEVAVSAPPPAPIENVPSAVSFGWSAKGTVTVVSGALNWPVFPFKGGEQDHKNRLEACHVLATDIVRSLRSGKWNARSDYAEILDLYVAYLPNQPGDGNFLLVDAEARIIRSMFAAEQDILPMPFAAKLKALLEQHIGLRAYYPETEDFYDSVRSGHLETPLPIDAFHGFLQVVRDNTPSRFEPDVSETLSVAAQPVPAITPIEEAPQSEPARPAPPPDPLGEVDPQKAQRFTLASGANELLKIVAAGERANKGVQGWREVANALAPYAAPIIEWLGKYLAGS